MAEVDKGSMRIKYRNTGFMRQIFIMYKKKYHGVEFNKTYFRYYKLTKQGAVAFYKEIRFTNG